MPKISGINKRFNTDQSLRQSMMDELGLSQSQLDAMSAFFMIRKGNADDASTHQVISLNFGSAVRQVQENSHRSPSLANMILEQVTEYVGARKSNGAPTQLIASELGMGPNEASEFVYKAEVNMLRYGSVPNGFAASPQRKILSKMNFWKGDTGASKLFRGNINTIIDRIQKNLGADTKVHRRNMPDTMGGHVQLRFEDTTGGLSAKKDRGIMTGSSFFEDGLKVSMINGTPVWNTTGHSGWYRDLHSDQTVTSFVGFATGALSKYISGDEKSLSFATGLATNSGADRKWDHVEEDIFMTRNLPGQQLLLSTKAMQFASDKHDPREFITYNKNVESLRRPMEMLTAGYGVYKDENGNIVTGESSIGKSIKRMGISGVHRNSMLGYESKGGDFVEERRFRSTLLPQGAPDGYSEFSYVADALVFPFSHPALPEGQGVISNKFAPTTAESLEQRPDKWGIELPVSIGGADVISFFEEKGIKINKGKNVGKDGVNYVFDKPFIYNNGEVASFFAGDPGRRFKNWKKFRMTGFTIYNPESDESGRQVVYPTGRVTTQTGGNVSFKASGIKAFNSQKSADMASMFGKDVGVALSKPSGGLQFMHGVLSYMPEETRRKYWEEKSGRPLSDMPTRWMDLSHSMTTGEQLSAWENVYQGYLEDNYKIINQRVTVSSDGLRSLHEAGQMVKGRARFREKTASGARLYNVDISVPAYNIKVPISAKYESQSQKSSKIGAEENTLLKHVAPVTYNRLLEETSPHMGAYKAVEEVYKLNTLGMNISDSDYSVLNIKDMAVTPRFMALHNEELSKVRTSMPGANTYEVQNVAYSNAIDRFAKEKFGDDAKYLLSDKTSGKYTNDSGDMSYIVPPKTMEYFSYDDDRVLGLLGGAAYTSTRDSVSNIVRWHTKGKGLKKEAIKIMSMIASKQGGLIRKQGFRANAASLHSSTIINAKYGSAAAVGENEVMRSDIAIARMFGVNPTDKRAMAALKSASNKGLLKELSWRNPLVNAEAQTSMMLNIVTEDMMRKRGSKVELDDAYGAIYNENSPMASGGDQDADESKGVTLSRLVRLKSGDDTETHILELYEKYGSENVTLLNEDVENQTYGEYAIINERSVSEVQDIINAATIHSAGEKQSRAEKIDMNRVDINDPSAVSKLMLDYEHNGFSPKEIALQSYEQSSLLSRQIGQTYNVYRRMLHGATNNSDRQKLISKIGEWNYQSPLDRKPWAQGSPEAEAIEFLNSFNPVSGKARSSVIDSSLLINRVESVLSRIDSKGLKGRASILAGMISDVDNKNADDIYGEIDKLYTGNKKLHKSVTDAVTTILFGGEVKLPDGTKKTFSSRSSTSNLMEFQINGELKDSSVFENAGKRLVGIYKDMLTGSPESRNGDTGQEVKHQIAALFAPSDVSVASVADAFEGLSDPNDIYKMLGDDWHLSNAPMAQVMRGMGLANAFKDVQRTARHLNDKNSMSKVDMSNPSLFLGNITQTSWEANTKLPNKLSPIPRSDGVGNDTFEALAPFISDYTKMMGIMGVAQKNSNSFNYLNTAEWMWAVRNLNPDLIGSTGIPDIGDIPIMSHQQKAKTDPLPENTQSKKALIESKQPLGADKFEYPQYIMNALGLGEGKLGMNISDSDLTQSQLVGRMVETVSKKMGTSKTVPGETIQGFMGKAVKGIIKDALYNKVKRDMARNETRGARVESIPGYISTSDFNYAGDKYTVSGEIPFVHAVPTSNRDGVSQINFIRYTTSTYRQDERLSGGTNSAYMQARFIKEALKSGDFNALSLTKEFSDKGSKHYKFISTDIDDSRIAYKDVGPSKGVEVALREAAPYMEELMQMINGDSRSGHLGANAEFLLGVLSNADEKDLRTMLREGEDYNKAVSLAKEGGEHIISAARYGINDILNAFGSEGWRGFENIDAKSDKIISMYSRTKKKLIHEGYVKNAYETLKSLGERGDSPSGYREYIGVIKSAMKRLDNKLSGKVKRFAKGGAVRGAHLAIVGDNTPGYPEYIVPGEKTQVLSDGRIAFNPRDLGSALSSQHKGSAKRYIYGGINYDDIDNDVTPPNMSDKKVVDTKDILGVKDDKSISKASETLDTPVSGGGDGTGGVTSTGNVPNSGGSSYIRGFYKLKSPEISAEYIGKVSSVFEMMSNPEQVDEFRRLVTSGEPVPKGHVLAPQISEAAKMYKDLPFAIQYAHNIISANKTVKRMEEWKKGGPEVSKRIKAYKNMQSHVSSRFGKQFETYTGDREQGGVEILTKDSFEEIKKLYETEIGTKEWKDRTPTQNEAWEEWKLIKGTHEQVVTKGGTFSGEKIVAEIGGTIQGPFGPSAELAQRFLDVTMDALPDTDVPVAGSAGKWSRKGSVIRKLGVSKTADWVVPALRDARETYARNSHLEKLFSLDKMTKIGEGPLSYGSPVEMMYGATQAVISGGASKADQILQDAAESRAMRAQGISDVRDEGISRKLSRTASLEARFDTRELAGKLIGGNEEISNGNNILPSNVLQAARTMVNGDALSGMLSRDESSQKYSEWNRLRNEYQKTDISTTNGIKAQQGLAAQMNVIRDELVSYKDDIGELRAVTKEHTSTLTETVSETKKGITEEKAHIDVLRKVKSAQEANLTATIKEMNAGTASRDDVDKAIKNVNATKTEINESMSRLSEFSKIEGDALGTIDALNKATPSLRSTPRKMTAGLTTWDKVKNEFGQSALNPRNMFYDIQNLAQMQYMIKEPLNRKRDEYLSSEYALGQMEASLGSGEISSSLKRFQAEVALESKGNIAFGRGVDSASSLGARNMMGKLAASGTAGEGVVEGMGWIAQVGATALEKGYQGYFAFKSLGAAANLTKIAIGSKRLGGIAETIRYATPWMAESAAPLFAGVTALGVGAGALAGGAILGASMYAYNKDIGGVKTATGGRGYFEGLGYTLRKGGAILNYGSSYIDPFAGSSGKDYFLKVAKELSEEDKARIAASKAYDKTTFAKLENIRDDNGDSRISDPSIVNTISSFGNATGMSLSELDNNKGGIQDTMVSISTRLLDLGITPDQLDEQVGTLAGIPQMLGLPTGSPLMTPIFKNIDATLQTGNLTDLSNLLSSYQPAVQVAEQLMMNPEMGFMPEDVNDLANAHATIASARGDRVATTLMSKLIPTSSSMNWSKTMRGIGAFGSMIVDPETGLPTHQEETWAIQNASISRRDKFSVIQEQFNLKSQSWQDAFDNRQWHIQQKSRETWGGIQSDSYSLNATRARQAYNRRKQYVDESIPMQNEQFGIQSQMFNMQSDYKREGFNIQGARMSTQWAWQQEDFTKQEQRMDLSYSWKKEDFAENRATFEMQAGWQTEDLRRSMRYATGRQRIDLRRKYERQLIMQNKSRAQMDKQESRADTQYGMAQDDLSTAEGRAQTKHDWGVADLARAKKYFEDMLPLQQRLMEISVANAKIQQDAAKEELENMKASADIAERQSEQYEIDRGNQRDAINEQHKEDLRRKAFTRWVLSHQILENARARKNNLQIKKWDEEHARAIADLNKIRDGGIQASSLLMQEEIDKLFARMKSNMLNYYILSSLISGAGLPNDLPEKKYAFGGPVNKPTHALIGEAGGEEYVVPQGGALVIRGNSSPDDGNEINLLSQILEVLITISGNTEDGNSVNVEGAIERVFNMALG